MKLTCAFLLPWFVPSLMAADISVTVVTTQLTIPEPAGYVRAAPGTAYDRLQENAVVPQNQRLASFVPAEALAAVERGEIPAIQRALSVQTPKAAIDHTVSKSDFKELKKFVTEQNAELTKTVEKRFPDAVKTVNERLKGEYGAKLDFSLSGMVPLGTHDDTERSLAFSMFVTYDLTDAAGKATNLAGVVTATFLHVRGKVLFLYVNGSEKDLEWTRATARSWAAAVIAANPSDARTLAEENRRSRGFDWSRVGRSALIGAGIGGVIAVILQLSKRKKSSNA